MVNKLKIYLPFAANELKRQLAYKGAFYLFMKSPVEDEKVFVDAAKKHQILVVPGSTFACPGFVRIAYCVSYDTIKNSLEGFRALALEFGLTKQS